MSGASWLRAMIWLMRSRVTRPRGQFPHFESSGHARLDWRDKNSGVVSRRRSAASVQINETSTHRTVFQSGFLTPACILDVFEGSHLCRPWRCFDVSNGSKACTADERKK
jgi:hypothetical protein